MMNALGEIIGFCGSVRNVDILFVHVNSFSFTQTLNSSHVSCAAPTLTNVCDKASQLTCMNLFFLLTQVILFSGTVGLVSRFGKFYKFVDPGLVKINPVTESLKPMDMRIQITEIPKQEVMTKVMKKEYCIRILRYK